MFEYLRLIELSSTAANESEEMRSVVFIVKFALLSAQLPSFRFTLIRSRPSKISSGGQWMSSLDESGSGCELREVDCSAAGSNVIDDLPASSVTAQHSSDTRKRPISGTERRSSEQTYDDPVGSDVDVAPVGSGDDDAGDVKCATSWNNDDEDSDCTESTSSGDVVRSPQRHSRPGVDASRTAHLDNIVVVNAREHDVDGYDGVPYWTSSSTPLSPSTRHGDWSSRRSPSSVARQLPATTGRGAIAVRTHAPPYRVDLRPTTTPWRQAAIGRATTLPSAAVRRRPGTVNSSSLGLNIGLIVGIAAGVVVLFLVLGYAVNRYRRCRGGADCGSYRLDRATGGADSCCRYNGLNLVPSQPPPPPPLPLGLQSTPRGCYGTSATALGKSGAWKLPSKEWYV